MYLDCACMDASLKLKDDIVIHLSLHLFNSLKGKTSGTQIAHFMRLVKVVQSSALIHRDYMFMFLFALGSFMFVSSVVSVTTALNAAAPCVGNTCKSGYEFVRRKPIVAGNWKMNSNFEDSSMLTMQVVYLTKDLKYEDIVVAIFPPFPLLQSVQQVHN